MMKIYLVEPGIKKQPLRKKFLTEEQKKELFEKGKERRDLREMIKKSLSLPKPIIELVVLKDDQKEKVLYMGYLIRGYFNPELKSYQIDRLSIQPLNSINGKQKIVPLLSREVISVHITNNNLSDHSRLRIN